MKGYLTRQMVAKELGRRVSRGEYERIFSGLRPVVVLVESVSMKARKGSQRVTMVMREMSPKWNRKHRRHVLEDMPHDRRCRYTERG
jgi:hypothetical protein